MSKIKRDSMSGILIRLPAVIAVCVFCIVFFAAQGRFDMPIAGQATGAVLSPFQRAAAWASSQVQSMTARVWDILTVHEQNRMLRNEVEELRAQNVQAKEFSAENVRLRELLQYKNSASQFDLVAARVIGREASTWTRMVVIDRGFQDGIQKNMAVVTSRGLVGVVTEAGPVSSKVEMILDPRIAVGALVQRSRIAGIVEGNPADSSHPQLVNIPHNEDVKAGDVLVTSGLGGIYPKGIVIGTVQSVGNDATGLLHVAAVETAVDFRRLEDVAVIVASREAPPEPLKTPRQTPGAESDPNVSRAVQTAAEAAVQEAIRAAAQTYRTSTPPAPPRRHHTTPAPPSTPRVETPAKPNPQPAAPATATPAPSAVAPSAPATTPAKPAAGARR